MNFRTFIPVLCALAGGVVLSGCGAGFIEGTVLDVAGETLPGVAVEVRGTPYQGLSDAHGRYRVKYQPGELSLYYAKTGYAPGMLVLTVNGLRNVEATPVVLWRLPDGKGVYLYEDHKYRRTDFIPPSEFRSLADQATAYGTTRWPKVETTNHEPLILCYKMPIYGCKLYQMNLTEALPKSGDAQDATISAWLPGRISPWSWSRSTRRRGCWCAFVLHNPSKRAPTRPTGARWMVSMRKTNRVCSSSAWWTP